MIVSLNGRVGSAIAMLDIALPDPLNAV